MRHKGQILASQITACTYCGNHTCNLSQQLNEASSLAAGKWDLVEHFEQIVHELKQTLFIRAPI